MPSGRTHDRITLWGLPCVAGLTFGQTHSSNLTLLVSGAFLFSGLMFGPDLDIYSVQYKRWGCLRWLWIPYQKIGHRSLLSHGLIIGTTLRLLYLATWLGILGVFALGVAQLVWGVEWRQLVVKVIERSLTQDTAQWIAIFLGLELGALSHSLSDWGGSAYKRFKKQASKGKLPHGRMNKLTKGTRRPKSVAVKTKSRRKH